MRLDAARMTFHYAGSFQKAHHLEAYEYLILEAMLGKRTLFTRSDGIERLWEASANLLAAPPAVEPYAPGSWGPRSAMDLIAPNTWCLPE